VICKLCSNIDNNSLLLVDRIEHGVMLEQELKRSLKNKIVYFIRGEVEVDQREKIRKMMEVRHDIVCVAISKIFSTGINIKNLHYIMFCSGGKAKVKIVQSIGRGLRKHDTKDKLIIIDLADQLHYGKQHMNKRIKLYDSENFKYDYQQIQEKN
jgi:superfamily II DNA or RNA helicase